MKVVVQVQQEGCEGLYSRRVAKGCAAGGLRWVGGGLAQLHVAGGHWRSSTSRSVAAPQPIELRTTTQPAPAGSHLERQQDLEEVGGARAPLFALVAAVPGAQQREAHLAVGVQVWRVRGRSDGRGLSCTLLPQRASRQPASVGSASCRKQTVTAALHPGGGAAHLG